MNGQPCIRNMRLTVRRVLEALVIYPNWEDVITEYPELDAEDIKQCLAFAAKNLDSQVINIDAAWPLYFLIREYLEAPPF